MQKTIVEIIEDLTLIIIYIIIYIGTPKFVLSPFPSLPGARG